MRPHVLTAPYLTSEPVRPTEWRLLEVQHFPRDEAVAREAQNELCRLYWRPVFAVICRQGHCPHDAQDLTQDFFAKLFDRRFFESATPERGRFRNLLFRALQNFLHDAESKDERVKRGGNVTFLDISQLAQRQLVRSNGALAYLPEEHLFDVRWAATIAEQALVRLRSEAEARGHRRLFDALSEFVDGEHTGIEYEAISLRLGVRETSLRSHLHRFRRRFGALLREEIARTVVSAAEVEDELHDLCRALASVSL